MNEGEIMINIYEELKSSDGNVIPGRTKLFIVDTDNEGNITRSYDGTSIIPESNGTLFIVDDWLIPQLEKVSFVDGELRIKDGKELIPPVKSEKELKREALLRQIAELDAEEDEPGDTEEQTDVSFLDYTDEPSE